MCGRMEVTALFPSAAPFNKVHANGDITAARGGLGRGLNAHVLGRVGEAAVMFGSLATTALELTAHLNGRIDYRSI